MHIGTTPKTIFFLKKDVYQIQCRLYLLIKLSFTSYFFFQSETERRLATGEYSRRVLRGELLRDVVVQGGNDAAHDVKREERERERESEKWMLRSVALSICRVKHTRSLLCFLQDFFFFKSPPPSLPISRPSLTFAVAAAAAAAAAAAGSNLLLLRKALVPASRTRGKSRTSSPSTGVGAVELAEAATAVAI